MPHDPTCARGRTSGTETEDIVLLEIIPHGSSVGPSWRGVPLFLRLS